MAMENGDDKRTQFTFEVDPKLNAALGRWRARKGLVKKEYAATALFLFATLGPLERDAASEELDAWVRSGADEIPNGTSLEVPREVGSEGAGDGRARVTAKEEKKRRRA